VKVRSVTELSEFLDADLYWRRLEITAHKRELKKIPRHADNPLPRAVVPIIYAHWEGYIKLASEGYLQHVSRVRMSFEKAHPGIAALAIKKAVGETVRAGNMRGYKQIVEFFRHNATQNINLSGVAIDTESNLSSGVLRRIFETLAIPYDPTFELAEKFLDRELLKTRNEIAHGRRVEVAPATVLEWGEKVVDLLQQYQTVIQNGAVQKIYEEV
jgi:hypothetical protein